MSQKSIISLRDLRFGYEEGNPVLNGLSLDIRSGSVTAILGPNGTGKTTLLNTILGLYKPHAGKIFITGEPLESYTRRDLSQMIGLVPQFEEIPFNFTVMEFVLLGRTPHMGLLSMPTDEDYEITRETLALIGISDLQDRSVQDLSGGERQMVLMARALAQNPRVLLLDEPTSHLDLSNTGRILNILKELAQMKGVSVVFTTHDPDAAIISASQLILMRAGKVLDAGPLEDVLTSEKLTLTYGTPVEVSRVNGRLVALLN